MRGEIKLESELGRGTKATFWIPFNKPQFTGRNSPLIDIGSIPDRLQSELSVSGCASDQRSGSTTPPQSPAVDSSGAVVNHHGKRRFDSQTMQSQPPGVSAQEEAAQDVDRKQVHVLVVEDK